MPAATSEDEPRGMNNIDYYQAEVDYRREQMLRELEPIRRWRRARAVATTKRRDGAPKLPLR